MKVGCLRVAMSLASIVLMGAVGSARASDEWFELGEKVVMSQDPSAEIDSTGSKGTWKKEDIKKVRLSVEGADVEISKIVLHWNLRPDVTITNVGTMKSGGQTAPSDAPGHEATLTAVTVAYKILNDKPTATFKVWGYD
jgi:hypothetical protein